MADVDKGIEEGEGQAAAEGEETPPPKSVFETYREKIEAGETVFGTVQEGEEAEGAEEEPITGEAAKEEEGDVDGEDEGAGSEVDEGGEEGAEAGAEDEGDDAGDAGEAGEDEGEKGDDDGYAVTLPGRNEGETVEFTVDTKEDQEALQRLRNGFMGGEARRAERARNVADQDEIAEIDALMTSDPAGFLLDKVAKDTRLDVVKALLLDPDTIKALQADESFDLEMEDSERELAQLKSAEARRLNREKVQRDQRAQKVAKVGVTALNDMIVDMIPEGMKSSQVVAFRKAALDVAESVVNKLESFSVSKEQLVAGLRGGGEGAEDNLLEAFGVDPEAPPGKGPKVPPKKKGTKGKAQDPPGKTLQRARVRRKNVAASSPAGAGSPPSSIELPKNQSITQRIAHARKVGIGNLLRGKG